MEPDQIRTAALAASRVIDRDGMDALSIEAVSEEAGLDVQLLQSRFESIPALLRELVIVTFKDLNEAVMISLDAATDGADALSRFIRGYIDHLGPRLPQFHQVMFLRALHGQEAWGLNPQIFAERVVPFINGMFDRVEAQLVADKDAVILGSGVHPRRLAFVGQTIAIGFLTLQGIVRSTGVGLRHRDEDLLDESSRAISAPIVAIRQLSGLNEISAELARLRDPKVLMQRVPELMKSHLSFERPVFFLADPPEDPPASLPPVAARAMREGRFVMDNSDGTAWLGAPVRREGIVCGVVAGVSAGSSGPDERHRFIIETFATMIGLAYENALLYEDLRGQVRARTKELEDAQAALVHSEKLAALGRLVAGIAHELNNPAGAVLSAQATIAKATQRLGPLVESSKESAKLVRAIGHGAEAIATGARRVVDTVDRLRRFSRLDAAELARVQLAPLIEDAVAMIRSELPEDARIETDLALAPQILCYPSELNQLLLQVLQNAAEAVRARGVIRVSVKAHGPEVSIQIADDGPGIAPEDLKRVFDPGFTTKSRGVGTGLGLAIAHVVAKKHRGRIEIDSEPGHGTHVRVVLPIEASE